MSSGTIASRRRIWSTVLQVITVAQCIACTALPSEASFATRPSIDRVGTAPWSGRDSFGTVLMPGAGDTVLIFGGFTPARSNETWISSDLQHWFLIPPSPSMPSPRNGHCIITHRGRMLVIGGFDGNGFLSDAYASVNGREWVRLPDAAFSPRAFFGCVSLNDSIYVFGGNVASELAVNDVWRSSDGISWEMVSSNASWSPRGMFASFALRGRIWLVGGGVYDSRYLVNVKSNQSDAWSSADGKAWERAVLPERFTPRRFMGSAVVSGTVFLVGGFELDRRLFADQQMGILRDSPDAPPIFRLDPLRAGREYGNLSEVWMTSDMESWYMMNVPVDFLARHAPGVMAYRQKVLILGGFGSELFNDIWVGSFVRN
jgi:hypothetical protein